jgi:hypothetical protein
MCLTPVNSQTQGAPAPLSTDWDRVTGITALVIGVVSLLVSSYTAHLQRAQVRADIWPHLILNPAVDR